MTEGLLDEYRKDVESVFGDDLLSLTLYGSHAAEDEGAAGREVSVLVVVRSLRRDALERFRAVARRYARRGIPAPPVLTESFLRESADVFPLEFLGIAGRRKVLSGSDVVASLGITTRNLRHQVEFELKGKLLALRRLYLGTSREKEVARLIVRTVGPVLAVARGLLLLEDPGAPHRKEEVLDAIEERFGVRFPLLREALAASRAQTIGAARAAEIAFGYIEEVERLCSLSDRFAPPPGR